MKELDIELLRDRYSYDSETGELKNKRTGKVITAKCRGYTVVKVNKRFYKAHRVAWAIHTGTDPGALEIDHINRDRADNRWVNLRLATTAQNHYNSGAWGITRDRNGWRAQLKHNGTIHRLGTHACPLMARLAYEDKRAELLEEFA